MAHTGSVLCRSAAAMAIPRISSPIVLRLVGYAEVVIQSCMVGAFGLFFSLVSWASMSSISWLLRALTLWLQSSEARVWFIEIQLIEKHSCFTFHIPIRLGTGFPHGQFISCFPGKHRRADKADLDRPEVYMLLRAAREPHCSASDYIARLLVTPNYAVLRGMNGAYLLFERRAGMQVQSTACQRTCARTWCIHPSMTPD
ncbi:hypothetical protein BKA64DRAFT_470611 [Cadophora sp. MPI-SDFR-AT-0126]|nr:hypothetical protein BKA64DRAFT_470611 [Leotiomycetes sp. MPI-SDFR-AT-0126]